MWVLIGVGLAAVGFAFAKGQWAKWLNYQLPTASCSIFKYRAHIGAAIL
jgi:hypothetical protein